jgi:heme A synthase
MPMSASEIIALVSKPAFRPIQMMSIVLVVLIVVQIILGFATLSSGNQAIAWIHFVNAMAIYGLAVSGSVIALRWDQMARARPGNLEEKTGVKLES